MKIAVLGANYQYLTFYRQTVENGHTIIAFGRAEDDHIAADRYAEKFYPFSFTEKDKILEVCRKEGVQGVTSFLIESALPYVYYIARGLGLPCNSPESEALTKNKYTMRHRMKEVGLSIPKFQILSGSTATGIDIPLPVIVKPVDNGGSRGINLVHQPEELQNALKEAYEWSPSKTAIVEQFIEGREFSVETISFEGNHYLLQITDKVTTGAPHFVELEHHQPAELTSTQWEAIKTLTLDTLSALQIGYGACHTEVKMDSDGVPYIIEVGPRMGGDFISADLVRLSTGYDFVNAVVEVACGHFTPPVVSQRKHSGVYFLCEETRGRAESIVCHPSEYDFVVDADLYGAIQPVTKNSDRGGYFIYQSDHKVDL